MKTGTDMYTLHQGTCMNIAVPPPLPNRHVDILSSTWRAYPAGQPMSLLLLLYFCCEAILETAGRQETDGDRIVVSSVSRFFLLCFSCILSSMQPVDFEMSRARLFKRTSSPE